jgi:cell fate (sporulation/competence/biofilm development) regulator YlbF (YheA/YmcA/DUF963 family)
MSLTAENPLLAPTQALCQALVSLPDFQSIRTRIDAFSANDTVRNEYENLGLKSSMLQQKQQMGITLTEAEIAEFEGARQTFLDNPLARDFLEAQQEMTRLQDTIHQYVSKTFELGRLPAPEDLSGCCSDSGGCGCN